MAQDRRLAEYRRKRNLARSGEPGGGSKKESKKPRFVVQKHDARTLHYDFRLEVDDVLKSWAVPKGPSTDPREKRLAMPTEDHPLDYIDFEGVIPEAEYGAGTVLVWDIGTYDNLTEKDGRKVPMADALDAGHAAFALHGQKLEGGWALTRAGKGRNARWLLVKMRDDAADARRNPVSPNRSRCSAIAPSRRSPGRRQSKRHDRSNRAVCLASGCPRILSDGAANGTVMVSIEGHEIELSNPDKVLFPGAGITKADLVDYYRRIAKVALPHWRGRPLSQHRFPDGIGKDGFFQKNMPDYFPKWVERAELKAQDGTVTYVLANNAASLVYLANQACITPHLGLSRVDRVDHPDWLVFDLDPASDDFENVRFAARAMRGLLDELELPSFVQTSGSKGLHVFVSLDRAADFDEAREFARDLAQCLADRHPDRLTVEQRKDKRKGRVYLDVMRNAYGQTTAAPYAVRAREGAPIATPLDWREVDDAKLHPQRYGITNVFRRLSQKGDPWADMYRHAQSIRRAREKLERLQA